MKDATTNFLRPRFCLWSLLLLGNACTLSDYSYLGAKRETTAYSENLGGMTSSAGGSGRDGRNTYEGGGSTKQNTAGSASTATDAIGGALSGNSVGAGGAAGTVQSGATYTASSAGTSAAGGTARVSTSGSTSTSSSAGYAGIPGQGGRAAVTGGGSAASGRPTVAGGGSSAGGASAAAGGSAAGGASIATGGSSAGGASTATGGSSAGGASTATGGVVSYTGMARIDVPFTTRGQLARYFMRFSPMVSVVESAVSGTLRIRVRAVQAGNTQYQMLIQQDSSPYSMCFSPIQTLPADITSSWVTLAWPLASCSANTSIGRLAFDLITSSATDAPTPSHTAILIDSIWIELNGKTISGPFNFDNQGTINGAALANDWAQAFGVLYLRPSTVEPAATAPAGSTISWQASL